MIPMIQSELNISQTLGGNSDYILGFNEPDMKCRTCWAHQAASTASGYWHQIEEMYPDKLLVAPVPISGPQYDPLGWLHDFRREYIIAYGRPPRFDAIAIHVYFYYANDVIPIIQQAEQLSIEWNVPDGVWITELGMPSGDLGGQWSLLLDWLDTQGGHQPGKVARVAPFGSSIKVAEGIEQGWYSPYWVDMSLVKDGILTDIGQDYLEHR